MCNNGRLLLEEETTGRKRKRKAKGKAGSKKLSAWTGVRFRQSTKWSTEIRMPRTRQKVWIGTFTSPRQAALAYDAAVFCFFGARAPKSRKVNFTAAPRPDISESARLKLSVADVKVIAEKHALYVDALLPPLPDADSNSTAAPDDLVMEPATPMAVDAPFDGAGEPAPPYIADEDDDLIDQMISSFDIEAFEAELEAATFIVSEDEYNEHCA